MSVLKEELYHVVTSDGISIALWKLSSETISSRNVFLTHGTFSNRKICEGIAVFLVERGFTCWIMEWRNHGSSYSSDLEFNFETIAKYDLKSTFDFLFETIGVNSIDCLAHSGGGIALTMLLINNPDYQKKVNSIILFGTQAFGAGSSLSNKIKIFIGKYVTLILGKIPAKSVGSTEHDESYYMMKQWFNWNLKHNFIGDNGFNYLKKMYTVNVPVLSICAEGDTFIAPKIGCKKFLNAFKNESNKLWYLSKRNGNLEDYNHSRILKSQSAKSEVWPKIKEWINSRTISF
ncbi:Predicted alpha/beta hydrolase [Tenacibaculum sp. MAR_2009_124]|uniref:alpha/beta hydrolase n=1 Tax=Tenacibaculum sp. MAR_2009_124 TaxID=1250059 RepID=UPI0008995957|nr:alpha/beta fold hydrolase [Tenacibaculum sp. MAR_2009_124]SEB54630.1 Predicted alpha/beta hydrolase [Tenacibaculum sp. MAR_2009_124]